jgi:transketolase
MVLVNTAHDAARDTACDTVLATRARRVRRRTLELIAEAQYGFIGSCCSCIDLLVCLAWSERTRCFADDGATLVLSKGHAAAALYAALLEDDPTMPVAPYAAIGSPWQAHPSSRLLPRVVVSTGTLGLGVAAAAGLALGDTLTHTARRTYALVGDGELQAGIVWESLLALARQPVVPDLTLVIDANGLQSVGRVGTEVACQRMLESIVPRVAEIDGHAIPEILGALDSLAPGVGLSAIWARTRRGAGLEGFDEALPMSHLPDRARLRAWIDALHASHEAD